MRERFFACRGKNGNLNLYLLDRVSNTIYHKGIAKWSTARSHQREDDMKFQSATHGTDRVRSAPAAYLSKENALLASAVALAFAFVTACVFMLG
jgi:hypothetical protein